MVSPDNGAQSSSATRRGGLGFCLAITQGARRQKQQSTQESEQRRQNNPDDAKGNRKQPEQGPRDHDEESQRPAEQEQQGPEDNREEKFHGRQGWMKPYGGSEGRTRNDAESYGIPMATRHAHPTASSQMPMDDRMTRIERMDSGFGMKV